MLIGTQGFADVWDAEGLKTTLGHLTVFMQRSVYEGKQHDQTVVM